MLCLFFPYTHTDFYVLFLISATIRAIRLLINNPKMVWQNELMIPIRMFCVRTENAETCCDIFNFKRFFPPFNCEFLCVYVCMLLCCCLPSYCCFPFCSHKKWTSLLFTCELHNVVDCRCCWLLLQKNKVIKLIRTATHYAHFCSVTHSFLIVFALFYIKFWLFINKTFSTVNFDAVMLEKVKKSSCYFCSS